MIRHLIAVAALTAALSGTAPALAETDAKFDAWLDGVRTEAQSKGITDATLERALRGRCPDPAGDRT